jgi:cell division septum initiation protein DivIVA
MGGQADKTALPMTARAAAAFADYAALGDDRSLRRLHGRYAAEAEATGGKPAVNLRQLEEWSSKFGWPDRIARAEEAEAAAILRRAARARSRVYERALADYDRRLDDGDLALADLHTIHDRVRPAEAAQAANAGGPALTILLGERKDGPQ